MTKPRTNKEVIAKHKAEEQKIHNQIRAIECEVCKITMGYVEGDIPPAAYCGNECIQIQAQWNSEASS